jgi:hypothetical protein
LRARRYRFEVVAKGLHRRGVRSSFPFAGRAVPRPGMRWRPRELRRRRAF